MKNFVLLLVLTALLSACLKDSQSDVDGQSMWTHYELEYDANTNTTTARSWFKFEYAFGTSLELADAASVRFNDEEMTWSPFSASYQWSQEGLVDNGTFEYLDLEGKTYINEVSLHPVTFPAEMDSVSRWDIYNFFWDGAPLAEFESMVLQVDNIGMGGSESWLEGTVGEDHMQLNIDELQHLEHGFATWYLQRSFRPNLNQATTAGGFIEGIYRPVDKIIYMK